MPEPIKSSELEKAMRDVTSVPEPDAEFLNSLRTRFIEEGHASAKTNQEIQMKKKTAPQRMKWVVAALAFAVLVLLFTRPTIVNALKRLFGYIPNVGIIDQSSRVMLLNEPVTITRDRYTVTVEQAVLNNEKTLIMYSYTIPPELVMSDTIYTENKMPSLALPDGTHITITAARHIGSPDCPQCFVRYLMEFPPLPSDVNEVILELPDLVAAPSDTAPRDWVIPLKFKPAGPNDIVTVIEQEVAQEPATVSIDTATQNVNTYGITNNFDKFVALPDGYILYGNTSWMDSTIQPYGVTSQLASIKDANGIEIPFDYADIDVYPKPGELRENWAYKIGPNFTPPLSFSFSVTASIPVDGDSFTFDPGPNPQLGQTWNVNQDVVVNNEVIHVLSVEQGGIEPGFFIFSMQSDSNIVGASIIDLDHPPLGGGGGGGGGILVAGAPFNVGFGYQALIPQGPLTLTFTNVELLIPGDWTLTWRP